MSNPLYASPAVCEQTLRALARYPARTAFAWPGGSISYRGATDLIGRIQGLLMRLHLQPGTRVAFLTANRADSWCAGVAAQLARLAITWLHPLGSLEDQLFQIEDSDAEVLVIDPAAFRDRGGELAAKASGIRTVFTAGPASYGIDLLGYTAWREVMPPHRLTFQDAKAHSDNRHVERECAAGCGLAIRAVAGIEQQRKRRDFVPNLPAGATARQRQRGTFCAHDRLRFRTIRGNQN